ncbi:hypothetical protein [Pseudoxanthomonas putridarboris]|uniref:Uncharacterized protein n=1 Tax=Pseudoxanthomonas putridarboris TaxID=752605 RepID=A0ABU9IVH7_9GAMM
MRISPAQAALLNARERQLLDTNGPYEIRQLVSLIKRTRELRDKQRDLAQRHRIAATGRSQSKDSAAVVRTRQKEQLFDKALKHYQAHLEKLDRECDAAMDELGMGKQAASTKRRTAKTTHKAAAPAKPAKAAKGRAAGKAQARLQAAFR